MAEYTNKRDYLLNKRRQTRYERELNNLILGASLNTNFYDDSFSSSMDLNKDTEIESDINLNTDSGVKQNSFSDTRHEISYNIGEGFLNFFEGIGDALITGMGAIGSWFGADDQWAKDAVSYDWSKDVAYTLDQTSRYLDPIQLIESTFTGDWEDYNFDISNYGNQVGEQTAYEQEMYNNSLLQNLGDDFHQGFNQFTQVIGEQLPSIALAIATGGMSAGASAGATAINVGSKVATVGGKAATALAKGVALGTMGVSATGRGAEQVFSEDSNNTSSEALLYGVLSGAVEVATELIPFPGGNAVAGVIGKKASGSIVKDLASSFVEEGIEEVISSVAQPFIELTYKNNESWGAVGQHLADTFSSSEFYAGLAESFIMGGSAALVLGGGSLIMRRSTLGKDGYTYADISSKIIESKNTLDELSEKYNLNPDSRRLQNQILKEQTKLENYSQQLVEVSERLKGNEKAQRNILKYFTEKSFEGNIEQVNKALSEVTTDLTSTYNYTERTIRNALNNFYNAFGFAPNVKVVEGANFNARYSDGVIEVNSEYEGSIKAIINHELTHSALDTLSDNQIEQLYNEALNRGVIEGNMYTRAQNSANLIDNFENLNEDFQERTLRQEVLAYYIQDETYRNLDKKTLKTLFNKENIKRANYDKEFNKLLKKFANKTLNLNYGLHATDNLLKDEISFIVNDKTTGEQIEGIPIWHYSAEETEFNPDMNVYGVEDSYFVNDISEGEKLSYLDSAIEALKTNEVENKDAFYNSFLEQAGITDIANETDEVKAKVKEFENELYKEKKTEPKKKKTTTKKKEVKTKKQTTKTFEAETLMKKYSEFNEGEKLAQTEKDLKELKEDITKFLKDTKIEFKTNSSYIEEINEVLERVNTRLDKEQIAPIKHNTDNVKTIENLAEQIEKRAENVYNDEFLTESDLDIVKQVVDQAIEYNDTLIKQYSPLSSTDNYSKEELKLALNNISKANKYYFGKIANSLTKIYEVLQSEEVKSNEFNEYTTRYFQEVFNTTYDGKRNKGILTQLQDKISEKRTALIKSENKREVEIKEGEVVIKKTTNDTTKEIDNVYKTTFTEITKEGFISYLETTNEVIRNEQFDILRNRLDNANLKFAVLSDSNSSSAISYFEGRRAKQHSIVINNFVYEDRNNFVRQIKSLGMSLINEGTTFGMRLNIESKNTDLYRLLTQADFKTVWTNKEITDKATNIKAGLIFDPMNGINYKAKVDTSSVYKDLNSEIYKAGRIATETYINAIETIIGQNKISAEDLNDMILEKIKVANEAISKSQALLENKKVVLEEVNKELNRVRNKTQYYKRKADKISEEANRFKETLKQREREIIEKNKREQEIKELAKKNFKGNAFIDIEGDYTQYKVNGKTLAKLESTNGYKGQLRNETDNEYKMIYNAILNTQSFLPVSPNYSADDVIYYFEYSPYYDSSAQSENGELKFADRKVQGKEYESKKKPESVKELVEKQKASGEKPSYTKATTEYIRNNELYTKGVMQLTNNAYVFERELVKIGVSKDLASAMSYRFRTIQKTALNFIEQGILLRGEKRTASLIEVEAEIYKIIEKKFGKLKKKELQEKVEQVTKYAQLYMFNNYQIDSNNAAIKVMENAFNERIANASEEFKQYTNLFYLTNEALHKADITRQEVLNALTIDILEIQNRINESDLTQKNKNALIKELKRISGALENVKVKTVFGKIAETNSIENLVNELDKELDGFKNSLLAREESIGHYIWESDLDTIYNQYKTDNENAEAIYKKLKAKFREFTNEEMRKSNEAIVKEYGQGVESFSEKILNYLDGMQQYRVQTGLITQEEYDYLKDLYPHYVPTPREVVVDGNTFNYSQSVNANKSLLKRKGSDQLLQVLQTTIMNRTFDMVMQARVQEFGVTVSEVASRNNSKLNSEQIVLDPESRIIKGVRSIEDLEFIDLNQTLGVEDNNTLTFNVFENGERVEKKIKLSNDAMQPIKEIYNEHLLDNLFFSKPLQKSVRLFREWVTERNPFFIPRNMVRDLSDALFTTKNGTIEFLESYVNAYRRIIRNDPNDHILQLFMSNGGASAVLNTDIKLVDLQKAAKKSLRKQNVLDLIPRLNAIVELAPRLAEFTLSYNRYLASSDIEVKKNALITALRDSADITTDFTRHGILTASLNRTLVPFLNASIQGFSKLGRFVIQPRTSLEWAKVLSKVLVFGFGVELLFELLNKLLAGEDWEAIPEYTKNQYLLVPVGNGNYIRIPRGRIVGTLQIFFRQTLRAMFGETTLDEAVEDFWDTATTNLSPVDLSNGLRTIFAPITDARTNTTWYGGTIDTQSDLNKYPSQRYDADTSEIAKLIGQIFNYSPKRIDYLLESYTGFLGDILLPATTKSTYEDPSNLLNFVKNNTTISAVKNFKYRGEAYELLNAMLYEKNAGNNQATIIYNYLNRELDKIGELEDQLDSAGNDAEKYTLYLTLREGYKELIENAELLGSKLEYIGVIDTNDRFAMTEAYRQVFGAEYALEYYNSQTKAKADVANAIGVDYETYYSAYFTIRGFDTKAEAVRFINSIRGLGYNERLTLQYLCGISLTQLEEATVERYLKRKGLLA